MPETPKPLASSQLPNAKGTLYTAPALTATLITKGALVNTGAAARTVNIYLKTAAGTSKRIIGKDTSLEPGVPFYIGGGHVIDAGGLLEGDASVAAEVDYYFSGVEFS